MSRWRVPLFALYLMVTEIGTVVRARRVPDATRALWGPRPLALAAVAGMAASAVAASPLPHAEAVAAAGLGVVVGVRLRSADPAAPWVESAAPAAVAFLVHAVLTGALSGPDFVVTVAGQCALASVVSGLSSVGPVWQAALLVAACVGAWAPLVDLWDTLVGWGVVLSAWFTDLVLGIVRIDLPRWFFLIQEQLLTAGNFLFVTVMAWHLAEAAHVRRRLQASNNVFKGLLYLIRN